MKSKYARLEIIKETILSRILPYIERELTESEYNAVDWIIDRFSKNIMNEVSKVKSVGQHLSAGLDTRSILAVLLSHNIKPICYTYERDRDIEVTTRICNRFNLKHIILNVENNHECFYPSCNKYETDIVFSGLMMSEYINFYNAPFEAGDVKTTFYLHIPAVYNLNSKIRLPLVDAEILATLSRKVPMFYRRHKKIQKLIIEQFCPVLNSEEGSDEI